MLLLPSRMSFGWLVQQKDRQRGSSTVKPRARVALLTCVIAVTFVAAHTGTRGASFAAVSGRLRIALTRQSGENGKLRRMLADALRHGGVAESIVDVADAPLIEHGHGPDYAQLEMHLRVWAAGIMSGSNVPLDVVVLTSPEAARVFFHAWDAVSQDSPLLLPVACVGKGTSSVVNGAGVRVAFEPTIANAEALAAELPVSLGSRVLYPASSIAPTTLQEGLAKRGFEVERLNTYTTRAVQSPHADLLSLMAGTDIATFGSPSAVQAWELHSKKRPIAACIGESSRKAALMAGFSDIFSPSQPSVEGWAESTLAAIHSLLQVPPEAPGAIRADAVKT